MGTSKDLWLDHISVFPKFCEVHCALPVKSSFMENHPLPQMVSGLPSAVSQVVSLPCLQLENLSFLILGLGDFPSTDPTISGFQDPLLQDVFQLRLISLPVAESVVIVTPYQHQSPP